MAKAYDKKQVALEKISINLEQVKAILADCKEIADNANITFNLEIPHSYTDLTYYPTTYTEAHTNDEDEYIQNRRGKWLSSTDECNL